MKFRKEALAVGLAVAVPALSNGQVVINEFVYDDGSTDDREFVELYNAGSTAVDIGGWSLGGRDQVGPNTWVNITGGTILAPGAYYVIGQTGVANVNQVTTSWLENDAEQLELWNGASGTGTLMDGVIYEAFRGPGTTATGHGSVSAEMLAQVTKGIRGSLQTTDVGATPSPLLTTASLGRHFDGVDSNNNMRDFGLRHATPGAANTTVTVQSYRAPNVDALADGASVPGYAGSFVGARVITPGVVTAGVNPNAIPAAPNSAKALVAWDNSGGGNAVVSHAAFDGRVGYDIVVYFDTSNNPLSSNASGVTFRGSEETMFGIGTPDALAQLVNISGTVGTTAVSDNGTTGLAWYYEKVGETVTGNGDVSEKLYLIDAKDGGNANIAAGALDWTVLATIDLSTVDPGWFRLALGVDENGNGTAIFNDQIFNFTTTPGFDGEFFTSYRENTQAGSVSVPSYLRPATFAIVPEPSSIALGLLGLAGFVASRKRA